MEDVVNFMRMEDNLNILANGRQPRYFGKFEDDLNILEDDFNMLANGRRPQSFHKWKTT